jgi:hypothetical protein
MNALTTVDNCPICLDPMPSLALYETECTHIFHKACLQSALSFPGAADKCPLCRYENPAPALGDRVVAPVAAAPRSIRYIQRGPVRYRVLTREDATTLGTPEQEARKEELAAERATTVKLFSAVALAMMLYINIFA